jgi:outer membrane immunogenic protein
MKRILLTTVSLGVLAIASPALGADLAVKAPPVSAVYDWTGYYIGGFGGYAFGNQNLVNGPLTNFTPFTANWETHGAFGGGEIGGLWQTGQIVWGVQADGFGSSIRGQDNFALTSPAGNPVNDANQLKWAASLRAQGGLAVDRLMLYFFGGWATGSITHTNTDLVQGVDTFNSKRNGLVAGGGMAYAMTDMIIGKIEYRYYDLGKYSRNITPATGFTPNGQIAYSVANTYSAVLAGIDFKFGGGGTVIAKY